MYLYVQFSQVGIHFVQGTVLLVIEMVQGIPSHCEEEFKGVIFRNGYVFYGWDFISASYK